MSLVFVQIVSSQKAGLITVEKHTYLVEIQPV